MQHDQALCNGFLPDRSDQIRPDQIKSPRPMSASDQNMNPEDLNGVHCSPNVALAAPSLWLVVAPCWRHTHTRVQGDEWVYLNTCPPYP